MEVSIIGLILQKDVMKKTTRSRIIEYMQALKAVTATDLARFFKITAGDARHHLTSLEDEGVVTVVDVQVHGRGRPTQVYRLSREITGHNLGGISSAILDAWIGNMPPESRENVYQKIASSFTSMYSKPCGSLTQRLAGAIHQLNEMKYQARWEAYVDSPRILITYCPYSLLLPEHPEICQIDACILCNLVGQSVRQIAMTGTNENGDKHCVFRVTQST